MAFASTSPPRSTRSKVRQSSAAVEAAGPSTGGLTSEPAAVVGAATTFVKSWTVPGAIAASRSLVRSDQSITAGGEDGAALRPQGEHQEVGRVEGHFEVAVSTPNRMIGSEERPSVGVNSQPWQQGIHARVSRAVVTRTSRGWRSGPANTAGSGARSEGTATPISTCGSPLHTPEA